MKSVENLTNIRVRFCSAFAMDDRIGAISLPNDSKKSRDKKSAAKELKKKKTHTSEISPDGGLSEGYGYDGTGVCIGDGQT